MLLEHRDLGTFSRLAKSVAFGLAVVALGTGGVITALIVLL